MLLVKKQKETRAKKKQDYSVTIETTLNLIFGTVTGKALIQFVKRQQVITTGTDVTGTMIAQTQTQSLTISKNISHALMVGIPWIIATLAIKQGERTMIAIIMATDAWLQALIVGGLIVAGMISAILQASFHGTIMSSANRSAQNGGLKERRVRDLNVTTQTLKTKTTGNVTGKTPTAWRLQVMHAGIN